jgi:hypothetical protein
MEKEAMSRNIENKSKKEGNKTVATGENAEARKLSGSFKTSLRSSN